MLHLALLDDGASALDRAMAEKSAEIMLACAALYAACVFHDNFKQILFGRVVHHDVRMFLMSSAPAPTRSFKNGFGASWQL